METRIKRDNYITIQGWMITDLDLKGNELLIYAIIYGFSQVSGQAFSGSLQYLADWTNSTKQGVLKALQSLCSRGYLSKSVKFVNGVKMCEYRANSYLHILAAKKERYAV
jgi:hypothetical protein